MNTTSRSLIILTMFVAGASASEPHTCQSSLTIADVVAAMGKGVAAQPVFAGGSVKGWRLYNVNRSDQLVALGIQSGTMMTHACGIPASEITAKGGNICCNVDASREVEVTFKVADNENKVMIKRPG